MSHGVVNYISRPPTSQVHKRQTVVVSLNPISPCQGHKSVCPLVIIPKCARCGKDDTNIAIKKYYPTSIRLPKGQKGGGPLTVRDAASFVLPTNSRSISYLSSINTQGIGRRLYYDQSVLHSFETATFYRCTVISPPYGTRSLAPNTSARAFVLIFQRVFIFERSISNLQGGQSSRHHAQSADHPFSSCGTPRGVLVFLQNNFVSYPIARETFFDLT